MCMKLADQSGKFAVSKNRWALPADSLVGYYWAAVASKDETLLGESCKKEKVDNLSNK